MLGIFYVENSNFVTDLKIIIYTAIGIFSRDIALKLVSREIHNLGGSELLSNLALRRNPLIPLPPPGASKVVTNREGVVD